MDRTTNIIIILIFLLLILAIILVIVYYKKPDKNNIINNIINKTNENINKYIETDDDKKINDNYIWDIDPCNINRLLYDEKMMNEIYNYTGNELYFF